MLPLIYNAWEESVCQALGDLLYVLRLCHIILSSSGFTGIYFFYFLFFVLLLSEYLGRSEGWTRLLGMFSAVLSALGVYLLPELCPRHSPVSFRVRHDFCNSLEHRQLDKGKHRRSSDQLDGDGEERERERERERKEGLGAAQSQKKMTRTQAIK